MGAGGIKHSKKLQKTSKFPWKEGIFQAFFNLWHNDKLHAHLCMNQNFLIPARALRLSRALQTYPWHTAVSPAPGSIRHPGNSQSIFVEWKLLAPVASLVGCTSHPATFPYLLWKGRLGTPFICPLQGLIIYKRKRMITSPNRSTLKSTGKQGFWS